MYLHTYEEITGSGWTVVAFETPTKVSTVVEIKEWCKTVYGDPGTTWKDSVEYGEVRFKNKEDILMFKLKWS